MKEQRFSIWQVLGVLAIVAALSGGALVGGLFVGYQLGRASARASAPQAGQSNPQSSVPDNLVPFASPNGRSRGTGTQPYLGVRFEPVTAELAQSEKLAASAGMLIREVVAGSPAEAAGLQAGDIIVEADGVALDADATLRTIVLRHVPGDALKLKLVRGSQTLEVTATLGEQQVQQDQLPFNHPPIDMTPAGPQG